MKESYIKKLFSERVGTSKAKRRESQRPQNDIIDFSRDEPDAMPDFFIIDTLYREASKWENRGYGPETEQSFNESASNYMQEFFGAANLCPEEEVCDTGGIGSALNMLALAFVNRGDQALITKPCGAKLETAVSWLGGSVIDVPLLQKNKFYPKYEEIPQKSLKKAKLLYLNYPGNPTGQSATYEFFKETVEFAKLNNLAVIHDAGLAALAYEEGRQLSFLSAPEAKKVGVELHSLSHGFNMAGWGIGFIAGNKNIIKAFRDIQARSGFYQYAPIRKAAAYALSHTEIPVKTAKKYERRVAMLSAQLKKLGFKVRKPKAGFYIFVKAPKATECGLKLETAREFEELLAEKAIKAKAFDDGYIRFSVTFPALGEDEEKNVCESFYERMKCYQFIF